eukprot:4337466-Lingulodinium_polyedra.AAC.1
MLDQGEYVNANLYPLDVPTAKDLDKDLTPAELTKVRGAWGGLQWKATQTGPQVAARLSALQGE